VLGFFISSSGTHSIPPVLMGIGDDDAEDLPTVTRKYPFLKLPFLFHLMWLVNFS
jgi:hypothetical protein